MYMFIYNSGMIYIEAKHQILPTHTLVPNSTLNSLNAVTKALVMGLNNTMYS